MEMFIIGVASFTLLALFSFILVNQAHMWILYCCVSWLYLIPNSKHIVSTPYVAIQFNLTMPRLAIALLIGSYVVIDSTDPLYTTLVYSLPLWIGVNMHLLEPYVDLSLSKKLNYHSPWFYVFLLFVIGTVTFQVNEWRKVTTPEVFAKCGVFVAMTLMAVVGFSLAFSDIMTLHLHHYLVGVLGMFFFQGPHIVSKILVALYFGVFLNGLCIWGPDPLWDNSDG